jgi:hypothetical protein
MIDQEDVNRWTVNPDTLKQDYDELKEEHEMFTKLMADKFMEMNRGLIKLQAERDEARAEVEQVKIGSDSAVQALHKQVAVQKSIANAHYENYCEMLKRIDVVAKERDEARAEVERLQKYPAVSSAPIPIFGQLDGQAPKLIRPEPSRLEIAAMLASGLNPCWNFSVEALFCRADAIIAKAKEVTK